MVVHQAGPPDGLKQFCTRCGEVLTNYINAMGEGDWRPLFWAEGPVTVSEGNPRQYLAGAEGTVEECEPRRFVDVRCAYCGRWCVGVDRTVFPWVGTFHPECLVAAQRAQPERFDMELEHDENLRTEGTLTKVTDLARAKSGEAEAEETGLPIKEAK